ncbi:MAG: hypothetical protein EZS28_050676, partial [Streblomastix strix]
VPLWQLRSVYIVFNNFIFIEYLKLDYIPLGHDNHLLISNSSHVLCMCQIMFRLDPLLPVMSLLNV